jgi:hypothetical protein
MNRAILAAAIVTAFASAWSLPQAAGTGKAGSAVTTAAVKPFLGRWDLTIAAPDREWPSWIEIAEGSGQVSAQFVGRWGNARPLPKIEIHGTHLTFVSPRDEEGSKNDLVFQGTLNGKSLQGTATGPNGTPWKWAGVRAPSLKRTHAPVWGEPVKLFNGKDLTGWKPSRPGAPDWTVENGNLIKPSNSPELITDQTFMDFKLHIEFNCGKEANSGVYLRGRYETQIETESSGESSVHHTGAIYGFIAPNPEQPRAPDVWQTYDITLVGRHVTVVQNGITVVNDQEIPGITGGALSSHEELPGPIYLQGGEKGVVKFRNIVITPAK